MQSSELGAMAGHKSVLKISPVPRFIRARCASVPSHPLTRWSLARMGMEYMFVDGTAMDRMARRSLRRHVMIGKNTGKTLCRPSRPRPHSSRPQHHPHNNNINNTLQCAASCAQAVDQGECNVESPHLSAPSAADDVYRTLPCPVEVSPASRRIIHECTDPSLLIHQRRD